MKTKLTLILVTLIISVGCMPPRQLTREEQLLSLHKKTNVAQKAYPDISKDKLIAASESVLKLVDPNDVVFFHNDDGFIMRRFYTCFMLFNNVFGYDYWHVDVIQRDGINILEVRAEVRQNMGMFATVPTEPPKKNLTVEESVLSEAEYILFFKRIDYMLGIEQKWMTCEEARGYIKENKYNGNIMFLCGDNYFGIEDRSPESQ
jgi:hypothetical protein